MSVKKVVLIQFRNEFLADHELLCIQRKIQDPEVVLESFNAFKKTPPLKILENYDAVILGGSGEYFVSKNNYPVQEKIFTFIRLAADKNIPILGLCFGFHLIGQALGGEVVHNLKDKEVGTYKIILNKTGQKNILFKNFPTTFLAQEGHKDHLAKLPKDGINLASSKKCRHQTFQIKGKRIFATQFHPELSANDVKSRLDFFKDIYSPGGEYEKILRRTKETLVAGKVIQNFINAI